MRKKKPPFFLMSVLAVCVIAIFAFVVWMPPPAPPALTLPTPLPSDGIYHASGPDGIFLEKDKISPETAISLLATLAPPEHYAREFTVKTYSQDQNKRYTVSSVAYTVWASGDKYKIRETRPSLSDKFTLIKKNKVHIWYADAVKKRYTTTVNTPEVAMLFSRMLSYADLQRITADQIVQAGFYTDSLSQEQCLFLEYVSGTFSYRTQVYLSFETGLILGISDYDDEELVYSMESQVTHLSKPSADVFRLPVN